MKRSSVLLLLCIFGLLLGGCVNNIGSDSATIPDSHSGTDAPDGSPGVFATYEIVDEQPDNFARWKETNERRIVQDKWDAYVDTVKHDLTADVDVSDDFVECDKSIDVTVDVENNGDETENVRVQLVQDKLVNSDKFVEVEPGHIRRVTFNVGVEAPQGTYTFEAQIFRNIKFDRENNVRDAGEFESRASKSIVIAGCR